MGKERTFVLDFRNSAADIQEAFRPFFEATLLEERSDPNQIYDLEGRIAASPAIDEGEIEAFAEVFFGTDLTHADRVRLEALVRRAVTRFEDLDDEAAVEEFRQLARSYMRFYAFVAQVVRLEDMRLEKLFAYLSWLVKLLPSRKTPPEIEITDDMLELEALKVTRTSEGSASLAPGEEVRLKPIVEFGANAYTEEDERSLSEIIAAFNERHSTSFEREDIVRFTPVKDQTLTDEMREMIRNNPADVVRGSFSRSFMTGLIRAFQKDTEMKSAILSDSATREQFIDFFFQIARREALSETGEASR